MTIARMTPTYGQRILRIDPGAILVTVGSAGSGKTGWIRRNFSPDQILAMDDFRRLVAGSETEYGATPEAAALLLQALELRARRRLTTALDGTFVDPEYRRRVLEIAHRHGRPAVAAGFLVPPELAQCRSRDGERIVSSRLLHTQRAQVDAFALSYTEEGWSRVVFLDAADPDLLPAVRYTLPAALPYPGPFDVIGDVHGCLRELDLLLDRLGYAPADLDGARRHPEGRLAAFVGDFADRGPDSAGVLRRVMAMHQAGSALAVPGNHCLKLLKYLRGRRVQLTHGLGLTVEQLERAGPAFQAEVGAFLAQLPQVLVLAEGRLVVFHAALARERVGCTDERTREQLTYGQVLGTDDTGLPIRGSAWTATWKEGEDEPLAIYGHTPVREPERRHNTINIDGGCVFGGYLAALRFPERTFEFVSAEGVYYESPKVGWRGRPRIP